MFLLFFACPFCLFSIQQLSDQISQPLIYFYSSEGNIHHTFRIQIQKAAFNFSLLPTEIHYPAYSQSLVHGRQTLASDKQCWGDQKSKNPRPDDVQDKDSCFQMELFMSEKRSQTILPHFGKGIGLLLLLCHP